MTDLSEHFELSPSPGPDTDLGESATSLFELNQASFSVGQRILLKPLTVTLPTRNVIGLIGHNGSGKSTLIKLLARQQATTGGVISFEGRKLEEWRDRPFARKVAYLPQQAPGAPGMLVGELVAFGRYPWHGALGRFGAEDKRMVEEAMKLTDVAIYRDRVVDTLSGGERQRVWLAMLVAQNPDCLLLDEPTSALDIAHQVEVLSLIRRLTEERGLGVVVVLHDVNMAARFCDEILALHSGELIARGTPVEILTPDRLQAIYGTRMGVMCHPDLGYPMSYIR
ncbi:ATP-binding cassette domain-containing protein [Aliirhizobium smilacinae]|uniref:ATP-binding cassette domain-containing protein n=1 Tax=Aliirhizobium smilacinae TaxID=1395944 RepID=A0A5C4XDG7_9HYPH|nr:ATP-binding cassette domain-containing protein [Rhizobium smilacinae]TNM61573.1 ATP-binding cassette domain-containing protein [Rhizobium smilacinae]